MIKVSRNLKELRKKINILEKEYEKENKKITLNDLKNNLKESEEDILLAQNIDMNIESINEGYSKEDDTQKEERMLIETNENHECSILEKIMLKDALKRLNNIEQEIIIRRYFKEETQVEIAKRIGVSQVQISRLEKKILQKMRTAIGENEF